MSGILLKVYAVMLPILLVKNVLEQRNGIVSKKSVVMPLILLAKLVKELINGILSKVFAEVQQTP